MCIYAIFAFLEVYIMNAQKYDYWIDVLKDGVFKTRKVESNNLELITRGYYEEKKFRWCIFYS